MMEEQVANQQTNATPAPLSENNNQVIRKIIKRVLIFLLILLALIYFGFIWFSYIWFHQQTAPMTETKMKQLWNTELNKKIPFSDAKNCSYEVIRRAQRFISKYERNMTKEEKEIFYNEIDKKVEECDKKFPIATDSTTSTSSLPPPNSN